MFVLFKPFLLPLLHNAIYKVTKNNESKNKTLGIPEATYYNWLKEGEKAEAKEGKLTKSEEAYLKFSESIKKAVQIARQKNL